MRYITHLSFSFLLFIIFKGTDGLNLLACLFGSLVPDVDNPRSTLGRFLKPIGWVSKHRGFFHSIFPGLLCAVVMAIARPAFGYWFMVGYLSHLALDALNHQGIAFFQPLSKFRMKGPFKSGGVFDRVIMIGSLVAVTFVLDFF